MEDYLAWAIVGLTLVIAELLSGTFYLLVLGGAAFGAALAAWLGHDFAVQVGLATVVAAAGCYWVHAWRVRNAGRAMPNIDAGQPANFESWVDQAARLARVRYRGALWDAVVDGDAAPEAGATLYVVSSAGNTLHVSARRPA